MICCWLDYEKSGFVHDGILRNIIIVRGSYVCAAAKTKTMFDFLRIFMRC